LCRHLRKLRDSHHAVINNDDSLFVFVGIAIDKDGVVYFADGANIRAIDESRNIHTLIGTQAAPRQWTPFHCRRVLNVSEVNSLHVHVIAFNLLIYIYVM